MIDAISVRERGSVPFIEKLSEKEVTDVLDPTYLVKKEVYYKYLKQIKTPQKYIFVYVPNGMDEQMITIINSIKKRYATGNVYVMMTRGRNLFTDAKNLKFVSLGQFLYLIKNASCVFTTSFHAVVFSTIFHTDFWCYDVPNLYRGEDIRLIDILDKLDLQDRLIKSSNLELKSHIDWIAVDELIEKESIKSWDFLKKQLQGD